MVACIALAGGTSAGLWRGGYRRYGLPLVGTSDERTGYLHGCRSLENSRRIERYPHIGYCEYTA